MSRIFLSLGSNLGDGPAQLDRALELLRERVGQMLAVSSYMTSEPWGFESEHLFTNAVCAMQTELTPMELLDVTQQIEREMGRTHKHAVGESYTDRIIDIDILTYDYLVIDNERLTLPHPMMAKRDFVMIPLREVQKKLEMSSHN